MRCISPISLKSQAGLVPCGKCAFCLKKSVEAWITRISHEMEYSSAAHFLTLTYDDQHLPPGHHLVKRDLQDFFRSLRKKNPGIRYFAIGEYGGLNGRPHYHAIVFNITDEDLVNDSWPHGFIKGSHVTMGRIRYTVQYVINPAADDREPPFRIMSRRPGIGAGHLTPQMIAYYRKMQTAVTYDFDNVRSMPRYYRDKVFTDQHLKALVAKKQMEYSDKYGKPPCPAKHEQVLRQLTKKHK